MQECSKCGEAKPAGDYYDSRPKTCRECVKNVVRLHRQLNIDRIRKYDRERGQDLDRKAAVKSRAHRYKNKGKGDWIARNHEKRNVHIMVGNAIKSGRLKIQPCERCEADSHIHAHHEDYSKPFDVTWLCAKCHGARHREINEKKRAG